MYRYVMLAVLWIASANAFAQDAATLARQKQIVAASLAFLDDVAGRREFARSLLLSFTRRIAPLVMENVTEATRAQLDAIKASFMPKPFDFAGIVSKIQELIA